MARRFAMFDRLFDCAKLHIQAGVMVSRPWPFETIVMAVLLEHEKRIERVIRELRGLTSEASKPPSGEGDSISSAS